MPIGEQAAEFAHRLYTCIFKLSQPPEEVRNHECFRAALRLLTDRSSVFEEQLFQSHQYWHRTLLDAWLPKQLEDRKVGINLSHELHQVVSNQLLQRNNAADIGVLEFFIAYFKRTLQSPKSHSYEVRIAIRGFGIMAAPCKALMPAAHIDELLTLVMQRTETAVRDDEKVRAEAFWL